MDVGRGGWDGVAYGGMGLVLWGLEVLGKGEGSDGLGRGWWWRVDRWMDGWEEGRKSEKGAWGGSLWGGRKEGKNILSGVDSYQ